MAKPPTILPSSTQRPSSSGRTGIFSGLLRRRRNSTRCSRAVRGAPDFRTWRRGRDKPPQLSTEHVGVAMALARTPTNAVDHVGSFKRPPELVQAWRDWEA